MGLLLRGGERSGREGMGRETRGDKEGQGKGPEGRGEGRKGKGEGERKDREGEGGEGEWGSPTNYFRLKSCTGYKAS